MGLMRWLAWLALLPLAAFGQELEPRAYSPNPVGTRFMVAAYGNTSGDVIFDPSVNVSDVHANVDSLAVGLGTVFGLFGRQAGAALTVPYAWADVSGKVGESAGSVTRSGPTDPQLRLSLLLAGGPALSAEEFQRHEPRTLLGASLLIVPPLGQYDSMRLINIGTNRWAFKPELGVSYPAGRWRWEAYAGIWLYTDNTNFLGGHRREQDPIKSYQMHVSYTIRPRLWLAADTTYYVGGTTSVDGAPGTNRQDNLRVGLTLSIPIARGHSLKLNWSQGAATRAGGDFTTLGVAWQYAWTVP